MTLRQARNDLYQFSQKKASDPFGAPGFFQILQALTIVVLHLDKES